MEKLVYVLWKPEAVSMAELGEEILGSTAKRVNALGGMRIKVLLADAATEPVVRATIRRTEPPIVGTISFWLDCVDERRPIEAELTRVSDRLAGYLVTESVPIPNRTHRAPDGERTPGITMLTFLRRPQRLSQEQWLGFWNELHTPMASEVQCTYLYVRNVVVRRLSLDAPQWAGIVEEGFPTDAVTQPMLWYRAEGSKEKLRHNLGQMLSSVRSFLDIDQVESLPMSEYVLQS